MRVKIQRLREAIKRVDKDIKDKSNNSIDYDNEKCSPDEYGDH